MSASPRRPGDTLRGPEARRAPGPRRGVRPLDDRAFLIGAGTAAGVAVASLPSLIRALTGGAGSTVGILAFVVLFSGLPLVGGLMAPRYRQTFTLVSCGVTGAYAIPFWHGWAQCLSVSITLALTAVVANGGRQPLPRVADEAKVLFDPSSSKAIAAAAVALGSALASWNVGTASEGPLHGASAAAVLPALLALVMACSKRRFGAGITMLSAGSVTLFGLTDDFSGVALAVESVALTVCAASIRSHELRDASRAAGPARSARMSRATLISYAVSSGLAISTTLTGSAEVSDGSIGVALLSTQVLTLGTPLLRTARRLRGGLVIATGVQSAIITASTGIAVLAAIAPLPAFVATAALHACEPAVRTARPHRGTPGGDPHPPHDVRARPTMHPDRRSRAAQPAA